MQLLPYLLNNKFHCWNCWGHSMGSHVFNMTNRTLYVEGIFMSVTTCMYYVFVHACLHFGITKLLSTEVQQSKLKYHFTSFCIAKLSLFLAPSLPCHAGIANFCLNLVFLVPCHCAWSEAWGLWMKCGIICKLKLFMCINPIVLKRKMLLQYMCVVVVYMYTRTNCQFTCTS